MLASTVAQRIRAAGIEVKSHSEGDESLDGEVTITDRVSVQVGFFENYLEVNLMRGTGDDIEFEHYGHTTDINKVVEDIRKALSEAAKL